MRCANVAAAAQLTGVRQLAAPGRAGREAPSIRRGAAPYGDGSRRSPTAQYSEILRLPLPRASPSPPAHRRPARLSPARRCTGRTKRAKAGSISALSGRLSRTLRGRAFSARSRGVLCVGDDYITSSLSRTQQQRTRSARPRRAVRRLKRRRAVTALDADRRLKSTDILRGPVRAMR